jgi:hypothetical protein
MFIPVYQGVGGDMAYKRSCRVVLSGRGREIKSSVGRAGGLSEHVDPVGLEGLLQSSGGNKISPRRLLRNKSIALRIVGPPVLP